MEKKAPMEKFSRLVINAVGDKCKRDSRQKNVQCDDSSLKPLGIINVMKFVSSALIRKGQQMVGLDRLV
jgi:hypothetical protein